jgi:hypothetical protein
MAAPARVIRARERPDDGHPHHVNVTMVMCCRICTRRLWEHIERIAAMERRAEPCR